MPELLDRDDRPFRHRDPDLGPCIRAGIAFEETVKGLEGGGPGMISRHYRLDLVVVVVVVEQGWECLGRRECSRGGDGVDHGEEEGMATTTITILLNEVRLSRSPSRYAYTFNNGDAKVLR